MDAADREKTAFVTQVLYEFKVMSFGLINAPATFERLMERVLRGIAWSECLVYRDDILVFGTDFATTLERLLLVLDLLGAAGLKLKAKKCQLFQEEIPFLGHIISASGIGADPAKCRQVKKIADPGGSTRYGRSWGYALITGDTFVVSPRWPLHCTSWQQRRPSLSGRIREMGRSTN